MANAKILEKKSLVVDEIKGKFENAKSVVVFDPRGLNVAEVTKEFKDLELTRKLVISKEQDNLSKYLKEEENENLSVSDLIDAFNNLLEKKRLEKPVQTKITKKELSVSERVNKIRSILKKEKTVEFSSLFEYLTRPYIVVTFLSILEMAKDKEITLKQDKNFGNILLERVD